MTQSWDWGSFLGGVCGMIGTICAILWTYYDQKRIKVKCYYEGRSGINVVVMHDNCERFVVVNHSSYPITVRCKLQAAYENCCEWVEIKSLPDAGLGCHGQKEIAPYQSYRWNPTNSGPDSKFNQFRVKVEINNGEQYRYVKIPKIVGGK